MRGNLLSRFNHEKMRPNCWIEKQTLSRPAKSETLLIPGAVGTLEAILEQPDSNIARNGIAICCHPHPLHGGTMTNKVIHTVARSAVSLGLTSIRFNFRGVGNSEGEYADGLGERDDLRAVIEWVKRQYPGAQLWLAGFSFGAYVSAMVAHEFEIEQLVSVAPPVFRFDFTGFQQPKCSWLAVMGDADEVVNFNDTQAWIESLSPQPDWVVMKGAGHFFHSRLIDLKETLVKQLTHNAEQISVNDD